MKLIAGNVTINGHKWCYIGQFEKDEEWLQEKVDTMMNVGDVIAPKQIIDTHLKYDPGNRLFVFSDKNVKDFFWKECKDNKLLDPYNLALRKPKL